MAAENPALLVYKLQTSAYKFSWALIPHLGAVRLAAVPVAARSGYRLYDHTVFVTYSIAFMTPAGGRAEPGPADRLGTDLLSGAALTFIPPPHVPAAARRLRLRR